MSLAGVIADGAKLERIASGLQFTEGPAWDARNGVLLFSDIPASRTMRWRPDRSLDVFRADSGQGNGLYLERDGALLTCEKRERRVTRLRPDGRLDVLVDRFDGGRLNSPNDIIADAEGFIYFTDPRFGRADDLEQPCKGVYRIAPDGRVTRILEDLEKPNGLLLTRDRRTLFIDDSEHAHVRRFQVAPDGAISGGEVFAECVGLVDGMAEDALGRLFVAADGVFVLDASGQHLGVIAVPETPSNLIIGGPSGRRLFITAQTSVYAIELCQGRGA